MAIPLIVLAIGSVLAGYVGVPHALGGSNHIETFLEPSFEAHAPAGPGAGAVLPSSVLLQAGAQPPAADTHAAEAAHADAGTELTLMALSSGIALAGIGIAAYFWLRNRDAADRVARSAGPIYQLLAGKYYVDEAYDAVLVRPVKAISTAGLWKGVDAGLIDGAVNGVGLAISGSSGLLRRTQTGSVRSYAFAVLLGVVAILGYYLFR
jgi:NADH-quinone oxidoreductase subunit L